jgi:hypothetical protein
MSPQGEIITLLLQSIFDLFSLNTRLYSSMDQENSSLDVILRRELYEGCLPIEITCEDELIASFALPKPFHVLASRYSYLPAICEVYINELRKNYLLEMQVS